MKPANNLIKIVFIIAGFALLMLTATLCKKENPIAQTPPTDTITYNPTPYQLIIPKFFPTKLNIPEDNPLTEEGIALGRMLFYDGRLSGRSNPDSMMSCATCHIQANSFECGINHPKFINGQPFGITGIPTPHTMLPLINLVWNENGYLWNGMISKNNPKPQYRNIEDLVWMGITAKHEMNSDTNVVKTLLQNTPEYPNLFYKAFGTKNITIKLTGKAIAQFIRTLISSNSKFDQYLRGETMLNQQEINGFVLFTTEEGADCFHCHGGGGNILFTTNKFYNNGKDSIFNDVRDRYHITGDPMETGAYRAPTLRNIMLTAPYMHDGRFKTIEEVIQFYNSQLIWSPYVDPLMHKINQGGAQLTQNQINDLIAFLNTLTDSTFINNPNFSSPN